MKKQILSFWSTPIGGKPSLGQCFTAGLVILIAPLVLLGSPRAFSQSPSGGGLWPLRDAPTLKAVSNRNDSNDTDAPHALDTPHYCDSDVLRSAATIHCLRFNAAKVGVAVGDHGLMLRSDDAGQTWNDVASGVECSLSDVFWLDSNRVIAVGGGQDPVTAISRGVVLVSRDQGQTWRRAAIDDLPRFWSMQWESQFTGRSSTSNSRRAPGIVAFGERDPITGNDVFLSTDGGESWQGIRSDEIEADGTESVAERDRFSHITVERCQRWREIVGQPCLVRMSCKIDEQTFLCAGDHGQIFRSNDGGRTWDSVREAGNCGLLVICKDLESIPWALVGRQALEQRLRCNLLVSANGPIDPAMRQMAMNLGVASIERCDLATDFSDKSLSGLLAIYEAPIVAVDASVAADLRHRIRLFAAQGSSSKVVEFSREGAGETLLHRNALLSEMGTLADDLDIDCQIWADRSFQLSQANRSSQGIYLNTVYAAGNQLTRSDDLSDGIKLDATCRLPKRQVTASRRRQQVVQGRLRQQSMIADLLKRSSADSTAFSKSLDLLFAQTSRLDRFRLAWMVAAQARNHPSLPTVLLAIEKHFPDTSSAQLAGLYARTRSTSLEWASWQRSREGIVPDERLHDVQQTGGDEYAQLDSKSREILPGQSGHSSIVSPFQSSVENRQSSGPSVVQTSAMMPADSDPYGNDLAAQNAKQTGQELDLAWQMHPVTRIVNAAIEKQRQHHTVEQENQGDLPASTISSGALRQIASQSTAWAKLLQPRSGQVAVAKRTSQPPKLDGKLDEAMWQLAWESSAATSAGALPIRIALAWDDEYLYLSAIVPQEEFKASGQTEIRHYRDADLRHVDRLKIGLDCDQDLLTSMNFTCSRDGRTRDDLDGVLPWDPTWYLATGEQPEGVVCEIAIELRSLCGPIQPGDAWFLEASTIRSGDEGVRHWMPQPETRIRVDFE
ncbi:hypothetical protein [Rhodopirellula sp. MGV]|uniref:hypothetical protein n=1 Tax=Rhodopirellula sp. MGV TaxID=2023130 RepID=UPI000B95D2AA|nr:hypothetical protein [Rhodopirellula sp. MGV]OYP28322.1 hypothetical protein CGZ80_26245 [Rhodopirellula sp. MGV]PNY38799.1 hypothetical protein C2E31_02545 [Rhodopirellula baltica]